MTYPLTTTCKIIDSPPFTITAQPNPYETPYIPPAQLWISPFHDSLGWPDLLKKNYHILMPIANSLEPQDLANLAGVSKDCYRATKVSDIWEHHLKKLLPAVTKSPEFDAEDQFKIIYKRINDLPKALQHAFECNNELLGRLRGPSGFNGLINRAWENSEVARTNFVEAKARYEEWMEALNNRQDQPTPEEFQLLLNRTKARQEQITQLEAKHEKSLAQYKTLNAFKTLLAGATYNGTEGTFGPTSIQARILKILKSPRTEAIAAFNCQPNFNEAIQQSSNKKDQLSRQQNYFFILILFANLSLMFASLYNKDTAQ